MKRIFLYTALIVMLLGGAEVYAAEGQKESIRISCNDVKFYKVVGEDETASETEIESPVPGNIKTVVVLDNYGDTDVSVLLTVAAVNKETGIFEYAQAENVTVPKGAENETVSATVNFPNDTDYEYKYFLWDSLKKRVPLGNKAPIAPTEAEVDTTTTKISLTWSGAEDDILISGYKIYRDDAEIATLADSKYTDTDLITGKEYSYKVTAVDELGAESEIPFTKKANTLSVASLNLTDDYDGNGASTWTGSLMSISGKESAEIVTDFPAAADKQISWGTKADKNGVSENCLSMTVKAKLYVNLDSALTNASDKAVSIILKYLDSDAKDLIIEYKDTNGDSKQAKIAKTNTGLWKSAEFVISDISLDNTYNTGKPSCFRINNNVATATPLYLAEIKVALGYDGENLPKTKEE